MVAEIKEQRSSGRSCIVLGEQSLLIQCAERLLEGGWRIEAVVSVTPAVKRWCQDHNLVSLDSWQALLERFQPGAVDWVFSITYLHVLPETVLALGRETANFHDGPLPRYAGLNAPLWALINQEPEYGITWHRMVAGTDRGDILVQRLFALAAEETALTLNARCYEEGLAGFESLVEAIAQGTLQGVSQSFETRTIFRRDQRPSASATLDWTQPAEKLAALVRALDHGNYPNPLAVPKIWTGDVPLAVKAAEVQAGEGRPGELLEVSDESILVGCGEQALALRGFQRLCGQPVAIGSWLAEKGLTQGGLLPLLGATEQDAIDATMARVAGFEPRWQKELVGLEPAAWPLPAAAVAPQMLSVAVPGVVQALPAFRDDPAGWLIAAHGLFVARLEDRDVCHIGLEPSAGPVNGYFTRLLPVPLKPQWAAGFAAWQAQLAPWLKAAGAGGYSADLSLRQHVPAASGLAIRVATSLTEQPLENGVEWRILVDAAGQCRWQLARDPAGLVESFTGFITALAKAPDQAVSELPLLSGNQFEELERWNQTALTTHLPLCIHQQFALQVAARPDATAVSCEGRSLTYRELSRRAWGVTRALQARGVGPGGLVGVMVDRSVDMLATLLGVLQNGCAYVPLDPRYPADRLQYMAEDAGLAALVCEQRTDDQVALPVARVWVETVADSEPDVSPQALAPEALAYVIYTSGSTGKPKGVQVAHRNVTNFFLGMDERLGTTPGTWLAVTSISFDISVLELLWTVCRGFHVVVYSDERRQKLQRLSKNPDFGLFYWNVADDSSQYDRDKYRLLLESARFADRHGFNSVWTPERHFASFGGLFPNPSVTSAALATITENVSLRAGSCVVPLHSPIRIAEEWSVVDNLSGGRVGLSIAAGWAPPDFAIKPETFADAKKTMFEYADMVRRLWRGETLMFPGPQGEVPVRTLPRPIQAELPIWVTTAGNVESFRQAAEIGANLLTHLLGQTVEEVAEKVRVYRETWRACGHPGQGTVTLMLHTFVGPDAATVESIVREPMKAYLKSAMFLVKAAAWQFPTFQKMSEEQGKNLDDFFNNISPQDLDDLLEFAFQRYFSDSGLFGTPESAQAIVARVCDADVDEIACLIDFGIDTQVVLDHLPWLNQLRQQISARAAETATSDGADYSLPALLRQYPVTHLQCTPSMATMLAADEALHASLSGLQQWLVGGEAFPPELGGALRGVVRNGRVINMYGPTETTIWSSCADVENSSTAAVPVGRPLPNQRFLVLDRRDQRLPPGVPGELVIAGAGVVPGYHLRPDLTAERFPTLADGGRCYRTGDLARWLPDGRLVCMGRRDHQIKIRGYRVELGEIEALLRQHPLVREAAVILREDRPGDQRLVAYVTEHQPIADVQVLRDFAACHLPEFMVPAVVVIMAALPLTPNGKIDRKALPAPPEKGTGSAEPVHPENAMQQLVAEIWQKILRVPVVGIHDNFFDIGGHSLLVVQVLAAIRQKLDRPLQMTDLFRYTTVARLAAFLTGEQGEDADGANRGKSRADARRAALQRRRR